VKDLESVEIRLEVGSSPRAQQARQSAIVIVGGGPCGLACASELQRLGRYDWTLLEAAPDVGGLASSVRDPAGFTWDMGGHVVFSSLNNFDALLSDLFADDELLRHERSSFIRHGRSWIPYPFQQHLHHLPEGLARACLDNLAAAQARGGPSPEANFAEFLQQTYGHSLVREFFAPYNQKVWTTDLDQMSASWIADRVAPAPIDALRRALDDRSTEIRPWGPNAKFSFPSVGGTGAIWRRLASRLLGAVRTEMGVVRVDAEARRVVTSGGESIAYRHLVATGPLDKLIAMTPAAPDDVRAAAEVLQHTTVAMVGLGYRAPSTDKRSWLYFPAQDIPFYRATNFGAYAAANLPHADPSRYSSWMTEVSLIGGTLPDPDALVDECDLALRRCDVVPAEAERISGHIELIPYAYPVPTTDRDAALKVIQPWLERHEIFSRGRFGTWRYEIGNMDHAVTMGQDIARRLTLGAPERLVAVPMTQTMGGPANAR
jgi:protoporphyrinogen oxidase